MNSQLSNFSHLSHRKVPGTTLPTLTDLTAEGFSANAITPGDVVLLQIVVGVLLMVGIALLGLQIG